MFPWQPVWPFTVAVRVIVAFNEGRGICSQASLSSIPLYSVSNDGQAFGLKWACFCAAVEKGFQSSGFVDEDQRSSSTFPTETPGCLGPCVDFSSRVRITFIVTLKLCPWLHLYSNWGHKWVSVVNLSETLLGGDGVIWGEEMGGE